MEKVGGLELRRMSVYGRAKSGTACSSETACFRWQRNSPPAPAKSEENPTHLPRSEREEASARFNPLQSKEGTKVMYRAGAHEGNMDAYDLMHMHMAVTFLDRPVGYGYGDTLVHRCHLGLSLSVQHSSPLHITSDITSEGKLQESPS